MVLLWGNFVADFFDLAIGAKEVEIGVLRVIDVGAKVA